MNFRNIVYIIIFLSINAIVTACVSEYVSLKAVAEDVEILSIEDLILGE